MTPGMHFPLNESPSHVSAPEWSPCSFRSSRLGLATFRILLLLLDDLGWDRGPQGKSRSGLPGCVPDAYSPRSVGLSVQRVGRPA